MISVYLTENSIACIFPREIVDKFLKVLFVRKIDFWVSFPTRQTLTLWGGDHPDLLPSKCQYLTSWEWDSEVNFTSADDWPLLCWDLAGGRYWIALGFPPMRDHRSSGRAETALGSRNHVIMEPGHRGVGTMCVTGVGQSGEMGNGPIVFQLPQPEELRTVRNLAWDVATGFFSRWASRQALLFFLSLSLTAVSL